MKRLLACAAAAMVIVALGSAATLAGPNTTFQTFGTGTVVEGPTGTWTITNGSGQYGGVYISSKKQIQFTDTTVFSFTSSGDVAGGAPRLSIPISANGNGTVKGYAFLDVLGCDSTAIAGSVVVVSTSDSNCHVNYRSVDYANWTAFLAAFPAAHVTPGSVPFVIADVAGTYVVSNIVLR